MHGTLTILYRRERHASAHPQDRRDFENGDRSPPEPQNDRTQIEDRFRKEDRTRFLVSVLFLVAFLVLIALL